jgi:hypothetical protein
MTMKGEGVLTIPASQ